jgi:hypothetical protein
MMSPMTARRRPLRNCTRALGFGSIAHLFLFSAAIAHETPCPLGPFETDRDKIAAALSSMPPSPDGLSHEQQSFVHPETWELTDGVVSEGAGGLQAPGWEKRPIVKSVLLEYDAKRYLSRYTRTEGMLRGGHLTDERYITSTVRPSVEEARNIACLVNQLVPPPVSQNSPERIATPTKPRCESTYSDGHWERLELRVGGAMTGANPALPCGDAVRLRALLSSAVGAPFANVR